MLYKSLTQPSDPEGMQFTLPPYMRFLGFSLLALVVAICAKIAPADAEEAVTRPEPLSSNPPEPGQMGPAAAETRPEPDRLSVLEAQVQALSSEIANIRKALEVISALPQRSDLPDPSLPAENHIVAALDPPDDAEARLAQLYAPPPVLEGAVSLFYEAQLGMFMSRKAAEQDWARLAAAEQLSGLQPRYTAVGAETRLSAGPLSSIAAADALCVELSALVGPCKGFAPLRAR